MNKKAEIGTYLNEAAQLLSEGKLVAIPTETVYGLAANALDAQAVIKIFEAKNRPSFDPLIVHTYAISEVEKFVTYIPTKAKILAEKFWPGPLTLLLEKKQIIPDIVTSGLSTVGVRIPNHPLTLELLKKVNFPLAAPSANPFGYVSPTNAQHVFDQLGEKIDYIVDGGACTVGVESTIIGFENNVPNVYRLGGLTIEEIENCIGKVEVKLNTSSNPVSPGMLKSHYSPLKELVYGNLDELIEKYQHKKIGVISFYKKYPCCNIVLSPEKSLNIASEHFFAAIRNMDARPEVEIILCEIFPEEGLGRALNDRLKRAAVK
ncbi:MAG: L-threonylcarbamoyladenylate synthase [Bacteroidia bacterium]